MTKDELIKSASKHLRADGKTHILAGDCSIHNGGTSEGCICAFDTRDGYIASWNNTTVYGDTQEEANEKLYQWFKTRGYNGLE